LIVSFKRSSVVAQVADTIRTEIVKGGWVEWIPSERRLSQTLHVSRNTCRAALRTLYKEGLLIPVIGSGIRVNRSAVPGDVSAPLPQASVGLIIPDSVNRLRPVSSLLIEDLREQLFDQKVGLHIYSSPAYYRARPHTALRKLVDNTRHSCWVLVLSHLSLQAWFASREIPCVVSGSVYPDIRLPSVDYDHRSVCRHAVGKLISLGHRRIVLLSPRWGAAGDLESEVGFLEGANASASGEVQARIVYLADDRQSIVNVVRRLCAANPQPTALIVANSYCYITVVTALARLGLLVPRDISIICREDDQFLCYIEPEPARYISNCSVIAKKIMSVIRTLLQGGVAAANPIRLFPRFTPGGSFRRL
jgi:LacI family transcriptional regulator